MAVFDPQQLAALQAQVQATQNLAPPPGVPPPNMPGPSGTQQVAAIPPPPPPNVAQPMATVEVPQPKPGPIKSLLTNLLYGGGQAMLQHVGLPTDYEKQQNELKVQMAQQQANSLEQYRQAEGQRMEAQTAATTQGIEPYTIPNQPIFGSFAGQTLPKNAAVAVMQKMAGFASAQDIAAGKNASAETVGAAHDAANLAGKQLQYAPGSPRNLVVSRHDGRVFLTNKITHEETPLGTDTSMITGPRNANARAYANAKYAREQGMDADGNPTTVSGLDLLRTGAPRMGEKATQTLAGDKLGAVTYLGANKAVEDNLPVLRDMGQRAIIARATEDMERNPGAFDSIINSSLQEGLSPEGARLIAAMKQMNEFGPTFKKYTGNGGSSTDSLRATIHSNQPSTANGEAVNLNLLRQDRNLATGVLQNLGRPGKYSVPSRPSAAPAAAPAAAPTSTSHPSFFHPLK